MDKTTTTALRLIELAEIIENNPQARESVAEGFRLIAEAMKPCEDCRRAPPIEQHSEGVTDLDASQASGWTPLPNVIAHQDNPETGA